MAGSRPVCLQRDDGLVAGKGLHTRKARVVSAEPQESSTAWASSFVAVIGIAPSQSLNIKGHCFALLGGMFYTEKWAATVDPNG